MDGDLLTLLRTNKVFSSLTKRVCKKLLPQFEKIDLNHGEILYHQGDPSDSIDILLDGRLVSILTMGTGEKKIVGYIEPGETIGEIGALSGEPRTTTIKAEKHSAVFKLSSEILTALCHQYPAVLFALVNPIISRSQHLFELASTEKFKKHIVFIPANEEISLNDFYQKFKENISDISSIVLLTDDNNSPSPMTAKKASTIIQEAKNRNQKKIKQKIIYLLNPFNTPLAEFCFAQPIDMLYIVGDDITTPSLNQFAVEKINQYQARSKRKPQLVLLHHEDKTLPSHTTHWLRLTEIGLHHHVRIQNNDDFNRLIRFVRDKAVGLVLGGGGTRGWGHIGAIKALREAGIPIDAIGGTSVGAIIAGCYAITESLEGTFDYFQKIIYQSRHSVSWWNLTWPAISLFNATGLTSVLQTLFDNILMEDLWLPNFCVSTNLSQNIEVTHQEGLLWEKTRASAALPGIIPPMVIQGELHFDGGLINNLPVDTMRKIVGQRGNVIAVELNLTNNDENFYHFPPILTFWQALLGELGISYHYKFPDLIDTFLQSLLIGSLLKSRQNGLLADILINLDLSRYPMLRSRKKDVNKIINFGYETTLDQIKNMRRKSN